MVALCQHTTVQQMRVGEKGKEGDWEAFVCHWL